jgi:hypothetical protein
MGLTGGVTPPAVGLSRSARGDIMRRASRLGTRKKTVPATVLVSRFFGSTSKCASPRRGTKDAKKNAGKIAGESFGNDRSIRIHFRAFFGFLRLF